MSSKKQQILKLKLSEKIKNKNKQLSSVQVISLIIKMKPGQTYLV